MQIGIKWPFKQWIHASNLVTPNVFQLTPFLHIAATTTKKHPKSKIIQNN